MSTRAFVLKNLCGDTYRLCIQGNLLPTLHLQEGGFFDRVRSVVCGKKVDALFVSRVRICGDTLRYLFGAFPDLTIVIATNIRCDVQDWGVIAAQQLRGKPLRHVSFIQCDLGRAGLRAVIELVAGTPRVISVDLTDSAMPVWQREEALLAARLVETYRSPAGISFWFGSDMDAPMRAALDRAMMRARCDMRINCTSTCEYITRARDKILALLFIPPSAGTPLARFMRKDGDHAIALRVLAMLGGDVVFDATTAEQAYDACVPGGVV